MRSAKQEGFPFSVSRYTDVPAFYMGWLRERIEAGFVYAPHPTEIIPMAWSLDPKDVASFWFWTKAPGKLMEALDEGWLMPYNVAAAVTINGWREMEGKSPDWSIATRDLAQLACFLGPERVRWRLSPIPFEPDYGILDNIASDVAAAGVKTCQAAFLQPNPQLEPDYKDKREIVERLVETLGYHGIQLQLCADDKEWLSEPVLGPKLGKALCVDGPSLEQSFGCKLAGKYERGCDCAMSVDLCSMSSHGCAMGCSYCYATSGAEGKGLEVWKAANKRSLK